MKTPMQEHIEWMQERLHILVEYGDLSAGTEVDECIQHAESMLEKERKVIEDAHIEGQRVFDNYPHTEWTNHQAEEYYNKTFNTKEK